MPQPVRLVCEHAGQALVRLHETGDYNDLTILCGSATFKVHRAIVCPQSGFLEAACKEGSKEEITGIIELHDEKPMFVQAMVEKFYRRMYYVPHFDNTVEPLQCTHDAETHSFDTDCLFWPYRFHTHMHSLGDKYDIPGLRAHACKRLRRLLKLAKGVYDLDFYIQIWDLFYQSSRNGDALREVLIESISVKLRRGSGRKLQRYDPFYSFVERSPEIAGELFKETLIYASFEEEQQDETSVSDMSSFSWNDNTTTPVAAEEIV